VTDIVKPGAGLIYMKVGTHAGEDLEGIIARKRKEISEAGYSLWGYGGNTCHPLTRVQPFARDFVDRGGVIYLCMQPMRSNHFAPPDRASESSPDGIRWDPIPREINVLGSRFALRITDLREETFKLPLASTRVAVGASAGKRGDTYISGRVDKACLEVVAEPIGEQHEASLVADIGLVATVAEPYAVLLR
jgi:hypothetical protein